MSTSISDIIFFDDYNKKKGDLKFSSLLFYLCMYENYLMITLLLTPSTTTMYIPEFKENVFTLLYSATF